MSCQILKTCSAAPTVHCPTELSKSNMWASTSYDMKLDSLPTPSSLAPPSRSCMVDVGQGMNLMRTHPNYFSTSISGSLDLGCNPLYGNAISQFDIHSQTSQVQREKYAGPSVSTASTMNCSQGLDVLRHERMTVKFPSDSGLLSSCTAGPTWNTRMATIHTSIQDLIAGNYNLQDGGGCKFGFENDLSIHGTQGTLSNAKLSSTEGISQKASVIEDSKKIMSNCSSGKSLQTRSIQEISEESSLEGMLSSGSAASSNSESAAVEDGCESSVVPSLTRNCSILPVSPPGTSLAQSLTVSQVRQNTSISASPLCSELSPNADIVFHGDAGSNQVPTALEHDSLSPVRGPFVLHGLPEPIDGDDPLRGPSSSFQANLDGSVINASPADLQLKRKLNSETNSDSTHSWFKKLEPRTTSFQKLPLLSNVDQCQPQVSPMSLRCGRPTNFQLPASKSNFGIQMGRGSPILESMKENSPVVQENMPLHRIQHAMLFGAPFPSLEPVESSRPKRRNVKISKDPQSVAARHRRERISDRIRVLQRLVPGGTKMDTASMLDEAIHYVKFLKMQVKALEIATNSTIYDARYPPMLFRQALHPYHSLHQDPQVDLARVSQPGFYNEPFLGHSSLDLCREQFCH